jgi:hypothetical protein
MDLNDFKCKTCDTVKSYSTEYDSYYCESCNEWLEDICTDRDCLYCNTRPHKPNDQNKQQS